MARKTTKDIQAQRASVWAEELGDALTEIAVILPTYQALVTHPRPTAELRGKDGWGSAAYHELVGPIIRLRSTFQLLEKELERLFRTADTADVEDDEDDVTVA